MSARVFPSSEAGQYAMRAAALRSLNTLPKKKKKEYGLEAQDHFFHLLWQTIVTTDTEVKHKRQAYVIQMCYRQSSRALKTTPPEKLPTPAVKYSNNIHIHHIVNKKKRTKTKLMFTHFKNAPWNMFPTPQKVDSICCLMFDMN